MNILPKKSWHVRNKDNIEKVRKDEQEARDKELEEARRSAKAEQEARTNFLRRRAAVRDNKAVSSADGLQVAVVAENKATPSSSSTMVQLFQANDERVGNSEHAAEKRAEQEKMEKKLGVLTYLGESSVELKAKQDKPWYFHAPSTTDGDGAKIEKDAKRKASLDPLNDLNKYVKRKRKKEDDVEKKRKKHKKKKSKSSSNKIEELREARLAREEREKARTDRLLNKDQRKSKDSSDDDQEMDLRNRAYNNQFNPHLAKKQRFSR